MKFRQFSSHFNLKSTTRMWRSLLTPPEELRLDLTLNSGQCFRWVNTGENEWTNVLKGRIVTLKQTSDDALFRVHPTIQNQDSSTDLTKLSDEMFNILIDYFQLDVKLGELYEMWSNSDKNFAEIGCIMKGIRMMRQDPVGLLLVFFSLWFFD
ncbi:hypothetical protein BKA69DRAFT_1078531 [Paraphysoderma sedebokerense]|nr:hypothetical protein BKA69DRAFT_1078531 [Paraphysoderma sedebokerense]